MKSHIMKTISYIILILGIIGSITYIIESTVYKVFSIELLLISIISVILLFLVFFTFAVVLEKLERIESFLFSEKENAHEEPVKEPGYTIFEDVFWVCPNCGRQNQSIKCYGCGLTKEEAHKKCN